MEAQLQMREALKSQEKLMKPLPPLEDTRFVQIISSFSRAYTEINVGGGKICAKRKKNFCPPPRSS